MGALLVAVVVADAGLAWLAGAAGWELAALVLLTAAVVASGVRRPLVAFPAAVTMALLTGGSLAALVFTSYQAGRRAVSRRDVVAVVAVAVGYPVVLLAAAQRTGVPPEPWLVLGRAAVLVALPLLAGRHLSRQGELAAERERLRIARDMHDSLGHALGLLSVRAAALEVGGLPAAQERAVREVAAIARGAVDELHTVVGALRQDDAPGLEGVEELVAGFRRAGATATLRRSGRPRALAGPGAGHAAYRVVQEGLTNAARHAPGSPVAVAVDWQPDALLISVANPVPGLRGPSGGTGLVGLSERVRAAGGLLRIHSGPQGFRVVAMFPLGDAG